MPQAEAEIFRHYRLLRREDDSLWELGRGAKAGDSAASRQTFAQALQTGQSIKDDYKKSGALGKIAVAQAESDDIAAAESTVRLLSPGKDRCEGYIAIAGALLRGPHAPDDDGP